MGTLTSLTHAIGEFDFKISQAINQENMLNISVTSTSFIKQSLQNKLVSYKSQFCRFRRSMDLSADRATLQNDCRAIQKLLFLKLNLLRIEFFNIIPKIKAKM